MNLILKYLKKYKWWITLGMTVKLIGTSMELLIPYVLEHILDDVAPQKDLNKVFLWGLAMIALALLVRFLNVFANRNSVKVSKCATYEIRQDLFWHSINLSGSQTDEFGLPSLTSRMTSDSYNVQNFIRSVQTLAVRAPILLVGGIVVTMTMDVGLAMILLIIAPILLTLIVIISKKGVPLYDRVQNRVDDIVRIMRENITGIRVVKALSKEDYERKRYGKANEAMARDERRAGVIMALPGPLMQLFLNTGLTLVVIFGAKRVNAGATQPGVILAFLTYFNMILMGVMGLNRVFIMASKANASAKRIQAVIDKEDELFAIPESEGSHTDSKAAIVFDNVSFRYDAQKEEPVSMKQQDAEEDMKKVKDQFAGEQRRMSLANINFEIQKGGSLGIIGATGCGKTTIINLLMRFYDPNEGHVFIDGKDVRTYDKEELHRKFGVVFQNDVIFADTIAQNIDFGRNVDDKTMRQAANDAMASDFIEAYDDQYQHMSNIHGANYSGGQKQRILISRALAGHPEILVLDDSSSALDYKTDANLRKAINTNYSDTTTIIIAQRISSIMNLDNILMLDEGRIIGYGSHDHLMKTCEPYQDIYRTQMGEES